MQVNWMDANLFKPEYGVLVLGCWRNTYGSSALEYGLAFYTEQEGWVLHHNRMALSARLFGCTFRLRLRMFRPFPVRLRAARFTGNL